MREIKFRGKRIDNGEWVYGDYFKTPLTDKNSGTQQSVGWFFLFLKGETRHCIGCYGGAYVVDEKTIGQFTGIKDKNGIEIYEKEILKCATNNDPIFGAEFHLFLVYYWIDGFYLSTKSGRIAMHNSLERFNSIEVIGNIDENPELLTQQHGSNGI